MATAQEFFERLRQHPNRDLLRKLSGSVRFDLATDGAVEHWHVEVGAAGIALSQQSAPADAVVRADKALFERIVSGSENAMAATLRGALAVEGDLGLVMSFQRLFAGPDDLRRGPGDESPDERKADGSYGEARRQRAPTATSRRRRPEPSNDPPSGRRAKQSQRGSR